MSMSTLNQLHADRTARLHREQRLLRRPTSRSALIRKERRVATARVATTC